MSKTLLKLPFFLICLTLFNCKNESNTFNKYEDQENTLVCNHVNTKLYFEALLSFEDDITEKYDPVQKNIRRAHTAFVRDVFHKRANYLDIASPYTIKIFKALKNDKDLWLSDNTINYNSKLLTCIGNHLQNEELKTTYQALISTHSMRPDIFGAPLVPLVKNEIGRASCRERV